MLNISKINTSLTSSHLHNMNAATVNSTDYMSLCILLPIYVNCYFCFKYSFHTCCLLQPRCQQQHAHDIYVKSKKESERKWIKKTCQILTEEELNKMQNRINIDRHKKTNLVSYTISDRTTLLWKWLHINNYSLMCNWLQINNYTLISGHDMVVLYFSPSWAVIIMHALGGY